MLDSLRVKYYLFSFLCLLLLAGLFLPKSAFAATHTLSGHVQNSSGTAVEAATIDVKNPSTNAVIATTTTDSSGDYSVDVDEGIYNVQVTPSGSGFSSVIALSQNISQNTTLNFVLTPAGTVTLSGHLYDPVGNPIPNQHMFLSGNGITPQATTDTSGEYSFTITPGTYSLDINYQSYIKPYVPDAYDISKSTFSITQSIILDLTLPTKKIDIYVQDSEGNPVNGVTVTTYGSIHQPDLAIGGNITDAEGYSNDYGVTNASGNTILALFPSTSGTPYTITATPPGGSNYAPTTVSLQLTDDTTQTITLPSSVTLSGYLYDQAGNPAPNQHLSLSGNGINAQATTNAAGSYSFHLTPGTYTLHISHQSQLKPYIPDAYDITIDEVSILQDRTLDLTLPTKKIDVHVQDSIGNSITGATVTTYGSIHQPDLSLNESLNDAEGYSNDYGVTNASGNTILALFPSTSGTPYTITVTPPSGSNYSQTTSSVTVTNLFHT